jgi:hypothetical protein
MDNYFHTPPLQQIYNMFHKDCYEIKKEYYKIIDYFNSLIVSDKLNNQKSINIENNGVNQWNVSIKKDSFDSGLGVDLRDGFYIYVSNEFYIDMHQLRLGHVNSNKLQKIESILNRDEMKKEISHKLSKNNKIKYKTMYNDVDCHSEHISLRMVFRSTLKLTVENKINVDNLKIIQNDLNRIVKLNNQIKNDSFKYLVSKL